MGTLGSLPPYPLYHSIGHFTLISSLRQVSRGSEPGFRVDRFSRAPSTSSSIFQGPSRMLNVLGRTNVLKRLKMLNVLEKRFRYRNEPSYHCTVVWNRQESRLKYWATRLSVRSHRSLVCLLHTTCVARVLHWAHSLTPSLTLLTPLLVGQ